MSREVELIKQLFDSPAGRELIEIWGEVYIDRPSYEPGRPVEDCIWFDGQKSMLISIKQMLEMKQ